MEVVQNEKYSKRVLLRAIVGRADGGAALAGQRVRVGGWVKSGQDLSKFAFLQLNDGSCSSNLQVVVGQKVGPLKQLSATGASVIVEGILKTPPKTSKERIELAVDKVIEIGQVETSTYPIAKTSLGLPYLRNQLHLRARTSTISAVARIRDAVAYATHTFFKKNNFLYIQTPIITTSDCEGAGNIFKVSTEERREASPSEPLENSGEFFGRQAFLTVSGQLQLETYACCLSNVYTFGPTFRAENSHTSRHLSEFWMIEPEIAFADLEDAMNCAEDHIKFLCQWLLDHCHDDMEFLTNNCDKEALDRLQLVASTPFARITYTEAIDMLKQAEDKSFENSVEWGIDLASEHERYLAEEVFKKPVIVHNYPKKIKAFYMRLNEDGETVAAMDVLVPKVGELVGGSQREERYDVLQQRLQELGLSEEQYRWYMDLRRYGTVKHAGYGLGFERMMLFATGLDNIRDVIPFPRYPGKAEF